MIRTFFFSCCLFLAIPGFSEIQVQKVIPDVTIGQIKKSDNVHPDSVQIVFNILDPADALMLSQHSALIQVKTDGRTSRHTISKEKISFQLVLSKGKHALSFYVNRNFNQISFEQLFQGGHAYEINLNFKELGSNTNRYMVEKPVIYLYSKKEQSFSLEIRTPAHLHFTYPAYNGSWTGTSSPDGTIRINDSSYPYLFWDAMLPTESLNPDWVSADQIKGSEAVNYLEKELSLVGMNQREKTDFITYWAPRMQKWAYVQITWLQNRQIDPLATLKLSPDYTQNRIYLLFTGSDQPIEQTLSVKPRLLQPFDRSGNYLVEWGGIELTTFVKGVN